MKICDTCGEPVAAHSAVCPFCETPLATRAGPSDGGTLMRTLDIESGLPTVDEALRRLEIQLERARAGGVRLVRVIHGWGSSTGGGGRIRAACRRWLAARRDDGRIRAVLCGDHYTPTAPEGRDLQRRYPALRSSERTDRCNPGITFVEL
jgi:hypothetical protein